jgi:hypothetical protein
MYHHKPAIKVTATTNNKPFADDNDRWIMIPCLVFPSATFLADFVRILARLTTIIVVASVVVGIVIDKIGIFASTTAMSSSAVHVDYSYG